MKKYPSYKNSGVEWIGKIPSHWDLSRLKYFSSVTLGKMLTNEDKGGCYLKPYLRSINIQLDRVEISDLKQMWFSYNELIKYRLKRFDLLVNEGGDVGRTCMWMDELNECYIQNSVNRVDIINGNNKYYLFHFYLHHQTGYFNSIVNRVSIPHLTKEKLGNVIFIQPPLDEQTQIVEYLDNKTQKIDDLIEKTEKKIELLKEKRTSLINHCVTKGLNPHVEMKDSGIEWIGEIPSHWNIKRLKYFSSVTLGKMLTNEDKGGCYLKPYLRSINIQLDRVEISDLKQMWFSYNELIKYRLKRFDLLVNEGGDVGRTCMWMDELNECYIQNSVNRVDIINGNNKYYLFHFYLHHQTGYFNSIVNRVSIPHLTKEKLGNVIFIQPPLDEQTQIVEYLDEKTQKIDSAIEKEAKRIELLKEYRGSLISEVVTGKVDVRGLN